MTRCWCSPLILTFSRREKEPPLAGFVKPENSQAESSFGFAQKQGALLPLPAGEGWGEGELHANPSATSLREWLQPPVRPFKKISQRAFIFDRPG
jgi:hypothetical protein